ncbi:cobaltochelatase subunit CobN [Methanopyrus kandleri]
MPRPLLLVLSLLLPALTSFAPVSCGEVVVISRYAGQFIEPLSKSGVDFLVIDSRSYDSLIVGANLEEVRKETCERIRNASAVVLYRSSGLTALDPYSAPEYAALAEALSRGVPFYVYQNGINIPIGSAKAEMVPLADRTVDVGGAEVPLYLFLTTLSERNLVQFFRYVGGGEQPRAFYLDGLLSLYDPLTDTVVSYDRPVDPIVILRYQREFPHGEVLSSYHGITVYPRWFVELIRGEVLPRLREIFDRYRSLGESSGSYTPGAPTVFVVFDSVNLMGRHLGYLDWLRVLTEKLRDRGFNVVPIALHYDILYMLPEDFLKALEPLVEEERTVCIMWAVNHTMMRYYGPDSRIVRLFERLNVPVIALDCNHMGLTELQWECLYMNEKRADHYLVFNVIVPENLGFLGLFLVGTSRVVKLPPELARHVPGGVLVVRGKPIEETIDAVVRLVEKLRRLREAPNRERRVALVYGVDTFGRDFVAVADQLDVPASILHVLAWLEAEGYSVETPWDEVLRRVIELDREALGLLERGVSGHGNLRLAVEAFREVLNVLLGLSDRFWREYLSRAYHLGPYVRTPPLRTGLNRFVERVGGRAHEVELLLLDKVTLDEYLEWYRSLPEPTRLYIERGILGYLTYLVRRASPEDLPPDERYLRFLRARMKELEGTVISCLHLMNLDDATRETLVERLREVFGKVTDLLVRVSRGEPVDKEDVLRELEGLWKEWRDRLDELGGLFGWGSPEGSPFLRTVDGARAFPIPGVKFGNVIVLPEPPLLRMRSEAELRASVLPPTHLYLAFWYYLTRKFDADAVIRVGSRGNLEWTPLKPILPLGWEFPVVLPDGTPIICLYHVGDPTGCVTARRRLGAIVLGHFPAPRNEVEFDPKVQALMDSLEKYLQSRSPALRDAILELVRSTGLYKAVADDLEEFEWDFDRCAEALYGFLRDLEEESGMCGLHVYGLPSIDPEDPFKSLECMVEFALRRALWEEVRVNWPEVWIGRPGDPVSRLAREVLERFLVSARYEIENLLRALRAEYVRPGFGGSPFRYLDVAPTGRNTCAYNVRRFPDEIAVSVSSVVATELYRRTEDRVMTVMGPTDLATGGLQYALALELLGYVPVKTSFRSYVPTTTGRASYGTNLTGEVIGVLPWELPLVHVRHPNVPVQTLLIRGRITEVRYLGRSPTVMVDDGTARVEVVLPEGTRVNVGQELVVLGIPDFEAENVRLLCSDLVISYSEEDVVDVADLVAMLTVCGGTSACVSGIVERVLDDHTVVLRSEHDLRAKIVVEFRSPVNLRVGERVVVVGELTFDLRTVRIVGVEVLDLPRVRKDVLLLVSGATFQGISPSALSLINVCRMLDVVAAEPWIALALGERSYLSPTARPHGAARWDALRDVLEALKRSLKEAEERLRDQGCVPGVLRELLDDVLMKLERDPLGTLRELRNGLKELNDYVVVGLRDLVGWNLAELLWSVAVGTGLWIPPSRNAPFLDWAVAYLVLREALEERLPDWLLGELTWENVAVMAGAAVFTQCPGEFIAPVLPMIEAGLYTSDSVESLGLRALVGFSYTVLPYVRSEFVGTRQPFLHCPLALAVAVVTSDAVLQVFDSYDDYSNLFCCGCTVDLEASARALLDYLLRENSVEGWTLDVSKVDLGAFKPGWNVAKGVGRLARLVGWREALLRAASGLKETLREIERGSGPLVSTRAYLVRSLLRTLYNRGFIAGLRRFGVSGALYLLRSLKRFATLGYVAIGRRDLAAVLPAVWSVVGANADWLASVPTALASTAFSLARASQDLGVPYPREALSWITSVACCCPELCAFQTQVVEGMAMETATAMPRTTPMTRPVLRPTVRVVPTVPAVARITVTVSHVAAVTGAVVGPRSLRPTGVSLDGVAGKITGGTEKGAGSTAARTGRVLVREHRTAPTSYFPRWLLALALLAGCFLAVWWARRYEPGPRGW